LGTEKNSTRDSGHRETELNRGVTKTGKESLSGGAAKSGGTACRSGPKELPISHLPATNQKKRGDKATGKDESEALALTFELK